MGSAYKKKSQKTLPQFLCRCGELWYGYPVFEVKNDIEFYCPYEKYNKIEFCPICSAIFERLFLSGGIAAIRNMFSIYIQKYAASAGNSQANVLMVLEELKCDLFDEEYGILRANRIFNKERTSAELKGKKLLDEMHVSYQEKVVLYVECRECMQDKYEVDVLISNPKAKGRNIVIQWDGDYFHGNTKLYPKLNENQLKQKSFDENQTRCLEYNRYRCLRFYESELDDDPILVKGEIWKALSEELIS